jgi:VWFA-related protein
MPPRLANVANPRLCYSRRMKSLLLVLPLAALTWAQPPQGGAPIATRLTLDVVAVDREGIPVTDLEPDEFEVWISGFRVPVDQVAFVTPETAPRTLVLLLDNVAVGPELALRVKETARAFLKHVGENDRVIVGPVEGPRTQGTGQSAQLVQAIERYHTQGFPLRIEDAGEQVLRLLAATSRQMAEIQGRKAIVTIGAAWLFDTPLPPPNLRDLHAEWLAAMRSMAAANVSLYVIDPVGLRPIGGYSYGGDSGFANETGGFAFLNTNDLAGAAKRIVDESGTYYLLRMANPPVQRTADLRKVEVKVLRKNVTIRARRGIPGK